MVSIGQYAKAVLADGLAAHLPEIEALEPENERLGVVTMVRPAQQTLVLEDLFGNEHVCYLDTAVRADLESTDEFIREWAQRRGRELTAPRK